MIYIVTERKRTMKKRIVALLLVLVLSMAMMVPAFAVAVEPRACIHSWIVQDSVIPTGYATINGTYHYVYWVRNKWCPLCDGTEVYERGSSIEGHWPPCSKCGCGLG